MFSNAHFYGACRTIFYLPICLFYRLNSVRFRIMSSLQYFHFISFQFFNAFHSMHTFRKARKFHFMNTLCALNKFSLHGYMYKTSYEIFISGNSLIILKIMIFMLKFFGTFHFYPFSTPLFKLLQCWMKECRPKYRIKTFLCVRYYITQHNAWFLSFIFCMIQHCKILLYSFIILLLHEIRTELIT